MAVTPTQQMALDGVNVARDMLHVRMKATAIYEAYWGNAGGDSTQTLLGTLADGDTVPGTDFTKAEFVAMLNLCTQFVAFFAGEAVAQAEYWRVMTDTRLKSGVVEE